MDKAYMKNVILFFVVSLLLIAAIIGHSFWIDSFDYWGDLRDRPAVNNPHKLKLDYIRKEKFDCIILGSSRAESFSPYQLSEMTGYNCVNLAVGGASTALKLLYLRESQKHQDLKFVFYVSDFYEFFETSQPEEVVFHPEIGPLVQEIDPEIELPNLLDKFLLLLDSVRFSRDMGAFKKDLKVVDLLGEKAEKKGLRLQKYLNDPKYILRKPEELERDWKRNFDGYLKGVWIGKFQEAKQQYLKNELQILNEQGVKIDVLLSPFYSKFNTAFELQAGIEISKFFLKWKETWMSVNSLCVLDYSGDVSHIIGQEVDDWDDGVHLNKFGAAKIIERVDLASGLCQKND